MRSRHKDSTEKKATEISVANAKREFSDLLGRVAYHGETILITRRGRPMARLVPIDQGERGELQTVGPAIQGWLADDDPFFEIVATRLAGSPGSWHARGAESRRGDAID